MDNSVRNTPASPYDPRFTEASPYAVDDGEMIGKTPNNISVSDLRELGHPASPIKAIRAKCKDCAANDAEVRKCVQYSCPLWHMRMGVNPFHGKAV